ncbi:hypothetical protein SeMB42_g03204 [Synchytrium endobioticum]|uniref:t-SNARE coiled-coil homology domain-containing protein n=1 Tax=Synchytrium endobioticum TaxID=286115 RepID=A0A507DA61_9FUNG|nr:hypothetical protein SeMB42_g03204 [Synchytrium endobioticum]
MLQHANLTKKFLDAMTEYKNIQKEFHEKYRSRLQRQFLIVKPTATAADVDKMLSGETGPIFAQQILETGQKAQARAALAEIQERHADIVRIEKSILELQQLFADMAVLVAAQGEQIDQIEIHVGNAVETTEKGVQALHKAVKDQKKSRRKMCIIMVCLIVICIVPIGKFGDRIVFRHTASFCMVHEGPLFRMRNRGRNSCQLIRLPGDIVGNHLPPSSKVGWEHWISGVALPSPILAFLM